VTALTKLPPVGEGGSDAGYWSGAGRYERGDRRDRRLLHWTYGQRRDQARIRRVLGLLERSWCGRRGKSYRTAGRILGEIALAWNCDQRISRVCKSSIAHRLGLHRNTVYRQCRTLIRLGLLIQGHYAAPKSGQYKSYGVFAIAGMSGRLPVIISFRRRHGRHARFVDITWPAVDGRYDLGWQPPRGSYYSQNRTPTSARIEALDRQLRLNPDMALVHGGYWRCLTSAPLGQI